MKSVSKISLVALFFLLIWLTNLNGQNSMSVESFDAVSVTGNIEVLLVQSDEESVIVESRGISEDKITVKVYKGQLKLKVINSLFDRDDEVKIQVNYRHLRGVRGNAGAQISNKTALETDKLIVIANSGSNIDLLVDVNAVDGSASEGAVLELDGQTDTQEASAGTGGQYMARNLKSNRTYARASTGGQVEIVADEMLDAAVNTGGTVEYKGEPKDKKTRSLLGGSIRRM